MPALNHVTFVIEPDSEAPPSGPSEPIAVTVFAELGYEGSDGLVADSERQVTLDGSRPAEPQVLELLADDLLEDLVDQAAVKGSRPRPSSCGFTSTSASPSGLTNCSRPM